MKRPLFALAVLAGALLSAAPANAAPANRAYDCATTTTTEDGTTVPHPGLQWYADQVGVGRVQLRNRQSDKVLGVDPADPTAPSASPASPGDPTQVWRMVSKGSK